MSSRPDHVDPDDPIEILLVEDNPGDVRLLQEAFEETDRETTLQIVTNGADAEEFLTRQATGTSVPDLVLLDLNLPQRDGIQVLETIRDDRRLQWLPVITLTGSGADEDIVRCCEAGTNAYLTKPVDPAEFSSLVEVVERFWLEHARLPPVQA